MLCTLFSIDMHNFLHIYMHFLLLVQYVLHTCVFSLACVWFLLKCIFFRMCMTSAHTGWAIETYTSVSSMPKGYRYCLINETWYTVSQTCFLSHLPILLAFCTKKSSMTSITTSDQIAALKNAGICNMQVTKQCKVHTKTIYHVMKWINETGKTSS